jgi:hypothetical protein
MKNEKELRALLLDAVIKICMENLNNRIPHRFNSPTKLLPVYSYGKRLQAQQCNMAHC